MVKAIVHVGAGAANGRGFGSVKEYPKSYENPRRLRPEPELSPYAKEADNLCGNTARRVFGRSNLAGSAPAPAGSRH